MSPAPTRRPSLSTTKLAHQQAESDARLSEFEHFCDKHRYEVAARLETACAPLDEQRAALRKQRIQETHDRQLDLEGGYRISTRTSGWKASPLWRLDGDSDGS